MSPGLSVHLCLRHGAGRAGWRQARAAPNAAPACLGHEVIESALPPRGT